MHPLFKNITNTVILNIKKWIAVLLSLIKENVLPMFVYICVYVYEHN